MEINRRMLLAGAGVAAAGAANAQSPDTPAPTVPPAPTSIEQRLIARALENVHPIVFDGGNFSGPGWDLLVTEGRASEFTLLGEEHGIREAPLLARRLFETLSTTAGYDTLALEISRPIAEDLDQAARHGLSSIRTYCQDNPPGPAFYFWQTEAELISAARAAVTGRDDVLWGLDYEVTGDRRLIARLKAKAPHQAGAALNALDQASQQAWATWRATHNPAVLFTFSGDPELARAVRASWPHPDADVLHILETLEETLEINRLYTANRGWESNERRANFMRKNLADHLNEAAAKGRRPKAMFKMGENHLQRGVNWTGNFDTGSLVHEVATLRGRKAFSFLVGGGVNAHHGVLNPTNMTTADMPVDMFEQLDLLFILSNVTSPGPYLLDLRPLRPLISSSTRLHDLNNSEAARNIHGYDALVVWNGSTATQMLVAP